MEEETSHNSKAADSQAAQLLVIFTAVITVAYGLFGMVENIWKDFFSLHQPLALLVFQHDISKTMIVRYYILSRDYIIPLLLYTFFSFFLLLEILLFIYARELLLVDTHNLSLYPPHLYDEAYANQAVEKLRL